MIKIKKDIVEQLSSFFFIRNHAAIQLQLSLAAANSRKYYSDIYDFPGRITLEWHLPASRIFIILITIRLFIYFIALMYDKIEKKICLTLLFKVQ